MGAGDIAHEPWEVVFGGGEEDMFCGLFGVAERFEVETEIEMRVEMGLLGPGA